MKLKACLKRFLASDWVVVAGLTFIFFLTHGYRFAWDDHPMEIPLLKSLIDHELFTRDYFVTSTKQYLLTYFFIILSKLITIKQIELVYFILFWVSRYFMFFWMYKLWLLISKNKLTSFCCVLSFEVLVRYQLFLYLTFSESEWTFAFIFAGFYYFFKERYLLASIILGVAANFHALFAAFPMMYVLAYLMFKVKDLGWKPLVNSLLAFLICASPVLIWFVKKILFPPALAPELQSMDWIQLYKEHCEYMFRYGTAALSQTFPNSGAFIKNEAVHFDIFVISLLFFNLCHNPTFRKETKTMTIFFVGMTLMIFDVLCAYFFPNELSMTIQFRRHEPYLIIFLIGYTTLALRTISLKETVWTSAFLGIMYYHLGNKDLLSASMLLAATCLLFVTRSKSYNKIPQLVISILGVIGVFVSLKLYVYQLHLMGINPFREMFFKIVLTVFGVSSLSTLIFRNPKYHGQIKALFIIVPLSIFVFGYTQRHIQEVKKPKSSIDIVRDDFKEMALYAKDHTPKSALFLIPYDLSYDNFRVFSERNVLYNDQDIAIFPYDKNFILERKKKLSYIGDFKIRAERPVNDAVKNAILVYHVDYIVFPSYNMPPSSAILERIHTTSLLGLYKVNYL